jgi:general secretion pathway protein N
MSKKTINPDDKEAKAYNWVLLATLLLVIFLIAQTPARIIANFLPNTTRAMFQAWGGTIWAGQVNSQYKGVLGQVRWQLDPLAFFTYKPWFKG